MFWQERHLLKYCHGTRIDSPPVTGKKAASLPFFLFVHTNLLSSQPSIQTRVWGGGWQQLNQRQRRESEAGEDAAGLALGLCHLLVSPAG